MATQKPYVYTRLSPVKGSLPGKGYVTKLFKTLETNGFLKMGLSDGTMEHVRINDGDLFWVTCGPHAKRKVYKVIKVGGETHHLRLDLVGDEVVACESTVVTVTPFIIAIWESVPVRGRNAYFPIGSEDQVLLDRQMIELIDLTIRLYEISGNVRKFVIHNNYSRMTQERLNHFNNLLTSLNLEGEYNKEIDAFFVTVDLEKARLSLAEAKNYVAMLNK